MWLLHPSVSFLAIDCCAASNSFAAVVFASPSPSVSAQRVYGRLITLRMMRLMAESQSKWKPCKGSQKKQTEESASRQISRVRSSFSSTNPGEITLEKAVSYGLPAGPVKASALCH